MALVNKLITLNQRIAVLEPVIDQKEGIVRIPAQGSNVDDQQRIMHAASP